MMSRTAARFLTNAESSFDDLARQPTMGAPLHLKRHELANIRKWRVRDFDERLVKRPPPGSNEFSDHPQNRATPHR